MRIMRETGRIEGEEEPIAACMFPIQVENVTALAFADTGSTISIISGDMARILGHWVGSEVRPTEVVAEVFGTERRTVSFNGQMDIGLAMMGGMGKATVQVLDGMHFDILIGDDVLSESKLNIDYSSRTVQCYGGVGRFARRGDVIRHKVMMEDLVGVVAK